MGCWIPGFLAVGPEDSVGFHGRLALSTNNLLLIHIATLNFPVKPSNASRGVTARFWGCIMAWLDSVWLTIRAVSKKVHEFAGRHF